MNVIAVKITKDNKVDITLEELNDLLEKVYNQGFEAGKGYTITTPSYPSYPQSPTSPISPISPYWYCGTCKDSTGITGVDCNKVVGKIDPNGKYYGVEGVSGVGTFTEVNL